MTHGRPKKQDDFDSWLRVKTEISSGEHEEYIGFGFNFKTYEHLNMCDLSLNIFLAHIKSKILVE